MLGVLRNKKAKVFTDKFAIKIFQKCVDCNSANYTFCKTTKLPLFAKTPI